MHRYQDFLHDIKQLMAPAALKKETPYWFRAEGEKMMIALIKLLSSCGHQV